MTLPPLDPERLLRESHLHAKKSLGQNFLCDQEVLREIVRIAGVTCEDEVLEIGAGLGSLTRELAVQAKRVAAVEIDHKMIGVLRKVISRFPNVAVTEGDILRQDPATLIHSDSYLVAANIPYYITSAVIRHLLEAPVKPRMITLTVQQEVAARICAKPGDMSLLALSVQVYGAPEICLGIPASAFYPIPEVDSAVLRITLRPQSLIPPGMLDVFFFLAKAGFSQKRKTLRNSLSARLKLGTARTEEFLKEAGVDPQRRAETLSVEEWGNLTEVYSRSFKPG